MRPEPSRSLSLPGSRDSEMHSLSSDFQQVVGAVAAHVIKMTTSNPDLRHHVCISCHPSSMPSTASRHVSDVAALLPCKGIMHSVRPKIFPRGASHLRGVGMLSVRLSGTSRLQETRRPVLHQLCVLCESMLTQDKNTLLTPSPWCLH